MKKPKIDNLPVVQNSSYAEAGHFASNLVDRLPSKEALIRSFGSSTPHRTAYADLVLTEDWDNELRTPDHVEAFSVRPHEALRTQELTDLNNSQNLAQEAITVE